MAWPVLRTTSRGMKSRILFPRHCRLYRWVAGGRTLCASLHPMRSRPESLTALILLLSNAAPAAIISSGPQNITLTGIPDTTQSLVVPLGPIPADWNQLKISIASSAQTGGSNDSVPGSWAVLGASPFAFPLIDRLNFGDPFPAGAVFGSGSLILWGYGHGGGDGEFYAPLQLGEPYSHRGWVHMSIAATGTQAPTITILGWAYGDAGEQLAMGEVPEPALAPGVLSALIALACWKRRRCSKDVPNDQTAT
jgi:hypothetical protein